MPPVRQHHIDERSASPAYAESYAALLQACEQARRTRRPDPARFPEVESAASGFARCAREERVTPRIVLEQLRDAVRPLADAFGIDIGELTRVAACAYYERSPDARGAC